MSTMLSNLDLLRRVPLFSLLTVAQAEVISGAVIKRRFKRGEALVEQGQKSNALFILLSEMGSLARAYPAVRELKRRWPDARPHFPPPRTLDVGAGF